mgnify:CR=1 FL=1
MADLTRAAELLAGAINTTGARWVWGRWDGHKVFLDDDPEVGLTAENAAGLLEPGSRVLCLVDGRRVIILGPVHQPSRASAGSNSNGSWWRSEDGMQICWVHTTAVRAEAVQYGGILWQSRWEWHYPMPFIGQPTALCGTWQWSTGASWGAVVGQTGVTSCLLRGWDAVRRTVADPLTISATAIGRWRS